MRVTDIDVTDIHFDDEYRGFSGHVMMVLQPKTGGPRVNMHFTCLAQHPPECPTSLVAYTLLKDALQQARRMPGFRQGERTIEVDLRHTRIAAA